MSTTWSVKFIKLSPEIVGQYKVEASPVATTTVEDVDRDGDLRVVMYPDPSFHAVIDHELQITTKERPPSGFAKQGHFEVKGQIYWVHQKKITR